ncbi:MAG: hypothetical protein U0T83_00390 [Bacteriovoracaceae bacterium]
MNIKYVNVNLEDDEQLKLIARTLKKNGENWARSKKLCHLDTSTHIKNVRMLEINQKQGFEILTYNMRKKLS